MQVLFRFASALLFGEQVAYVGQRLHLAVIGIGHAFIDPVKVHQCDDPAQAEGRTQHLTHGGNGKENGSLAGVEHGELIVLAEEEGQDKEHRQVGKCCQQLIGLAALGARSIPGSLRPGSSIRSPGRQPGR